jgi:hypothetical protein
MNIYFKILDDLEFKSFREHFLKEYIPVYFTEDDLRVKHTKYKYFSPETYSAKVSEFEQKLIDKYNFPPIEYFLIFIHYSNQRIHVDGIESTRHASLNLALQGYKSTKMKFYSILKDSKIVLDAQYHNINNLKFEEEFSTPDNWMLVNSGEPHHVVNINKDEPRITVCLRFKENPLFSDLLARSQKK